MIRKIKYIELTILTQISELNKFDFSSNERNYAVYSLLFSENKRYCTSLDAIENEIDHRSSR